MTASDAPSAHSLTNFACESKAGQVSSVAVAASTAPAVEACCLCLLHTGQAKHPGVVTTQLLTLEL